MAETRDLDENTVLDLDTSANVCAITRPASLNRALMLYIALAAANFGALARAFDWI